MKATARPRGHNELCSSTNYIQQPIYVNGPPHTRQEGKDKVSKSSVDLIGPLSRRDYTALTEEVSPLYTPTFQVS